MARGTVIGHEEYRRRPAGTRVRMSAAASTRCIRGSAPLSVPFRTGGAHAHRLATLPVTRGRRPQGCSSTALTVHDRGGQRSNRPPPPSARRPGGPHKDRTGPVRQAVVPPPLSRKADTMSKPIDYDSPRRPVVEMDDDSLEELKARSTAAQSPKIDLDEADTFDLPGADLSGEELTVAVVPMQRDEFRCTRCFLVHHRSRLPAYPEGQDACQDCF